MILLILLYLILLPIAVMMAVSCKDEVGQAQQPARVLLALFLLLTLAFIAFAYAPLWLQILLVVLLLVGFRQYSPLFLFRWLSGPFIALSGFLPLVLGVWTSVFLLLATLMAAVLFAHGLKKPSWKETIITSLRWYAPIYIPLALFCWLFLSLL